MARYFMGGTRHAAFERMMMESSRLPRTNEPQKKKRTIRKGSREKQKGR